jgi:hypothetical protein
MLRTEAWLVLRSASISEEAGKLDHEQIVNVPPVNGTPLKNQPRA